MNRKTPVEFMPAGIGRLATGVSLHKKFVEGNAMLQYNFTPERIRFHLQKPDTLMLSGWYRDNNPRKRTVEIYLDNKKLNTPLTVNSGVEVRQKYLLYHANVNEELVFEIVLPKDWRKKHRLDAWCIGEKDKHKVISYKVRKLVQMERSVEHYIESVNLSADTVTISGWAAGADETTLEVFSGGTKVPVRLERFFRKDVTEVFKETSPSLQAGFKIVFSKGKGNGFTLVITDGSRRSIYKNSYHASKGGRRNVGAGLLTKLKLSLQRNGLKTTLLKVKHKLFKQSENNYNKWRLRYLPSKEELEMQRKSAMENGPAFSVVIPLYQTPEKYLCEMLDSVLAQTYANWELCLADGGGMESRLTPVLERYAKKDARVRFITLAENLGISENTNAAVKMAKNPYIVFADHDDILPPEALFTCAEAILRNPDIDMLYSDEDKVDMAGKVYFEPNFKPDFNIDLLRSMNYICHLCVVKHTLIERAGLLRKDFDGAQDYDFILRCVEKAECIHHIPKVLYHWRCHLDSTAANPESKLYAFEAGRRALEEHYDRLEIPAKVEHSTYYGMYHTCYKWTEKPLVSVLIPNKDHIEDLDKCIRSLLDKSAYRNLEILIIENNSTDEVTFAYYDEIEKTAGDIPIRVIYWEKEFNYSAINNFGAAHANGTYLLLLNNDTELINPDTISEMLGFCMREDVGVVGAKLNYEDDTIQHAGVVIGFGGIAGHTFIGSSRYDLGYQGRIVCAQDYSAVTAACLMTKRKIFEQVGGLTEKLRVAFNDIDYCLKVRRLGKLVVYNPYAELYHYESKSRGLEDTPEKVARFQSEIAVFQERWQELLEAGDPYFNPNLSLDKADFSLK